MQYLKTIKHPTLEDLNQLLSILSRFPYIGALISLLSSLMDLYDIFINLFKKSVLEKNTVLSAALYRFCGHTLIGLGGLVPLVTIAAFMILNPCIIPLVALAPVIADFYKFCKITYTLQQIVKENERVFKEDPTAEKLKQLKESRVLLYDAKRERAISLFLVIGTALSALGLIFPPLLMVGLGISIVSALGGFLDKRYHMSERFFQSNVDNPINAKRKITQIMPFAPQAELCKNKVFDITKKPSISPKDSSSVSIVILSSKQSPRLFTPKPSEIPSFASSNSANVFANNYCSSSL